MLNLASDDLRKRAMQQRMTPIQAPRPVAPSQSPSVTQQFAKAALDRGINTAVEGGTNLAVKYGKPLLNKGIAAVTPAAAPTMAQMTGPTSALLGAGPGPGNALLTGGAQAAGAAGTGASAGLMSSLGAAGTAAMASPAAPIIGGLLAMKMLGFFSEGGHVGPLNKMSYKSSTGDVMTMAYGGPLTKGG